MIELKLTGRRSFEVASGQHKIIIDTPPDKSGQDSGMMPTDLFAASLGGCLGMTAAAWLEKYNLPIAGLKVSVEKTMTDVPSRKIGGLKINISLPVELTTEQEERLRSNFRQCPVWLSIQQAPEVQIVLSPE